MRSTGILDGLASLGLHIQISEERGEGSPMSAYSDVCFPTMPVVFAGGKTRVWEHVFFGGNVGTVRSRRTKEYRGVHPKKLRKRVEEICEEFNEARVELIETETGSVSVADATYAVARLYAKLLRAHPWVDGNLRVAFVALHAALLSLDLPRVMFPDLERHDDLVGIAFRDDDKPYLQLATYIADYIRDELAD
jgi:prophage maintenance system killer protein